MTLNEKFELSINYQLTFGLVGVYQIKRAASNVEQIADEYAIEFALWWVKNNVKILTITPNYTDAEILQIFKKEKGL